MTAVRRGGGRFHGECDCCLKKGRVIRILKSGDPKWFCNLCAWRYYQASGIVKRNFNGGLK